jgi:hypothetical protein
MSLAKVDRLREQLHTENVKSSSQSKGVILWVHRVYC